MDELIVDGFWLLIGYAIAWAVYMACSFGFVRFARNSMVVEGRPLAGFYVASVVSWLLATMCACFFVVSMEPSPWMIAIMGVIVLGVYFRSMESVKMDQATTVNVLCSLSIVGGAALLWQLVS